MLTVFFSSGLTFNNAVFEGFGVGVEVGGLSRK